jgi:hypothetical protein
METAHAEVRHPVGREISREQAKEEIKALLASKGDKLMYVDDVMEALDLGYELVAEVCQELERDGEIKEVRVVYDIHTKVAAILKTPDADLLKGLVDVLFERQYDPEPLSPKERKAIKESEEELRKGDFIGLEELEKKLGLWHIPCGIPSGQVRT